MLKTPRTTGSFQTVAVAVTALFGASVALLGCPGPQPSTISTGGQGGQGQGPSGPGPATVVSSSSSSGFGGGTPASSSPASSVVSSSTVVSSSAVSSSGSSGAVGTPCSAPTDCADGQCVTGFCCDSPCMGVCMACSADATNSPNGTCANVRMGLAAPSQTDCQENPPCGNTGACDGSGGCLQAAAGMPCGTTMTCSGQMVVGDACDGQGKCATSTTPAPCPGNFACEQNACLKSCASPTDCISSFSCNTETAQCVNDGETCTMDSDCTSAICGPGPSPRCCSLPCTTLPVCGVTGCDTSGACEYPSASTPCQASACSMGMLQTFNSCDGEGSCAGTPSSEPMPCTPYVCADQFTCGTSCASDGDCAFGYYCSANQCVGMMQPGNTCTADDQCVGGTCSTNCCGLGESSCLVGASNPCGASRCDSSGNCAGYASFGTSCGADQICDGKGICVAGTLVFVSSGVYDATFNGSTKGAKGADDACQALGAKLGGTWLAWTSDDTTSPVGRFTQKGAPFYLLNGTTVASSLSAMLGGTIMNAINIDETGTMQPSVTVWTGTGVDGKEAGMTPCANWTSTSSTANAAEIGGSFTSAYGWTESDQASCSQMYHIYCFQQ